MKTKLFFLSVFAAFTFGHAQVLMTEGFDDITTLAGAGWEMTNQSSPLGATGWSQGSTTVFNSQSGAATSYISANYNNASGAGTISNWLITPQLMLQDGDVVKFWTRNPSVDFPDRLEVRSSAAPSYTAPSGATDVGSFTGLLLEINPSLTSGSEAYPIVWTEFVITVSGLSTSPVPVNLAFRYFVTNAGPSGSNSNYIGIDTFSVERPTAGVSDVNKSKFTVYPNPTSDYLKINSSTKISSVEVFDISGKKVAAEVTDNVVDVQKLEKGSYLIRMTSNEGSSVQKFIKK